MSTPYTPEWITQATAEIIAVFNRAIEFVPREIKNQMLMQNPPGSLTAKVQAAISRRVQPDTATLQTPEQPAVVFQQKPEPKQQPVAPTVSGGEDLMDQLEAMIRKQSIRLREAADRLGIPQEALSISVQKSGRFEIMRAGWLKVKQPE